MLNQQRTLWEKVARRFRDGEHRTWIWVCPAGMADTFMVCSLARAFRQHHGTDAPKLTVVVKANQEGIAHMFAADIPRILTWGSQELLAFARGLAGFNEFRPDYPIIVHPHYMHEGQVARLYPLPGISSAHIFENLLHLPLNTPRAEPVIKEEWRQAAHLLTVQEGMRAGRSVLLFPDANSWPTLPDGFWGLLAGKLLAAGFQVFSNCHGDERGKRATPIPGTRPIAPPIELVQPLAEHAGWAITSASGVANVLSVTRHKARLSVVVRGPAPGNTTPTGELDLESAYPYNSMAKFDGIDHGQDEIEFREGCDAAAMIDLLIEHQQAGQRLRTYATPSLDASGKPAPRIEISIGDLVDRITILRLKLKYLGARARDQVREDLANHEALLDEFGLRTPEMRTLTEKLQEINEQQWQVIDRLDDIDDASRFLIDGWSLADASAADQELIERQFRNYCSTHLLNRERTMVKRRIDELFGSAFRDFKSYVGDKEPAAAQ